MQLEFKEVSYSYTKSKKVLENINFEIKEGITVLCGDNGSGKSTLINLINFIYSPLDGEVFVDGIKYNKKQKLQYRKNIATVYQFSDVELFNLTVQEDLLYAVKTYKKDVSKAKEDILYYLDIFNLDHEILDISPFKLSGGQKKKIAIISSLILRPKILILDEPLIGLDNTSKNELLKIIKKLKKDMKIIMVLHDYDYIFEVGDNIIELKHNTIESICSKDIYFKNKYENKKSDQLTSVLNVSQLLNIKYDVAKNLTKETISSFIKDNYELH